MKREEKINSYKEPQAPSEQPVQMHVEVLLQQKQFLSIDETSILIGASRRTIHRLIAAKRLQVGKVGSRTIITRKAIDHLFNMSAI